LFYFNPFEGLFMLETWLGESSIALNRHADDYKEAIHIGGELLVNDGKATPEYVSAMIDAVKEFGPYMVIAPGIAMPHARPEDGALAVGLSLVTLSTPVCFGNPENDPVRVVTCLCSTDSSSHIELLQRAVALLGDSDAMSKILSTNSVDVVMDIIRAF
jgi:mannitol/fructose-specific phosphotransferase system IIA component (Ntr-type)